MKWNETQANYLWVNRMKVFSEKEINHSLNTENIEFVDLNATNFEKIEVYSMQF